MRILLDGAFFDDGEDLRGNRATVEYVAPLLRPKGWTWRHGWATRPAAAFT
ncbi:MAG: hypothetical protein R2838_16750 [Caldilineaceae bacterium]